MKKIIFSIFCFSILLAGCQSKTLENNLSQIRIAKAAELEEGKTKTERAKEIEKNSKLYNTDLHKAVFCVPNFVRKIAEDA